MRKEKQYLLEEIQGKIVRSAFILMKYQGFHANMANQFRRELAKVDAELEVVRKRLLMKASAVAQVPLDSSLLEGHIGIVFTENDPLATAKLVVKFGETNNKAVEIIGGRIDGQLYSGADVEELSKLPGKEEMRSLLLGTFEAPLSQTLAVFEALLSSVVYCLDNKASQQVESES